MLSAAKFPTRWCPPGGLPPAASGSAPYDAPPILTTEPPLNMSSRILKCASKFFGSLKKCSTCSGEASDRVTPMILWMRSPGSLKMSVPSWCVEWRHARSPSMSKNCETMPRSSSSTRAWTKAEAVRSSPHVSIYKMTGPCGARCGEAGRERGGRARGTHHIRELELDHRREFRLRRERGGVEGWQGQFDRDGGTGRKIEPPSLPRARREPRAPRGRRIRDARARQRETIERTHVFDAGRHGRCRRPCGTRGWRACAALGKRMDGGPRFSLIGQ